MKVLWFTNTPSGASEKIQPTLYLGGWMSSVEEKLVEDERIELSVCFYWDADIAPFEHKRTMYYPIYRKNEGSHLKRFINRVFNRNTDPKDIHKLLEIIDKVKPDVIHIHGTEKNYGLIQNFTKVPAVLSVQGILLPYTQKFFAGISFIQAYLHEGLLPKLTFTSIAIVYREFKYRASRERLILASSKHILGRTSWDKRITRLISPNSEYHVFEDALRPVFYQKQWSKDSFGTPLTIVSVLTEGIYKGLETVVDSARILKDQGIEVRWTIIGLKQNSPMVRIVRNSTRETHSELNISIAGSQSDVELAEIMLKADIYCHPSHIENSPCSVCEAMLLGMPVVATHAGGTDTLFANGQVGILIQDGDPYSMAGAINELKADFETARRFGIKARENALKKHNPHTIANALIDIYQHVAEQTVTKN